MHNNIIIIPYMYNVNVQLSNRIKITLIHELETCIITCLQSNVNASTSTQEQCSLEYPSHSTRYSVCDLYMHKDVHVPSTLG